MQAAAHSDPVDVVIETVGGTANTIEEACFSVRRGGSVAVLGLFTNAPTLPALAFLAKEIRLIGSMTYSRSERRADFDLALELLAAAPEKFRALITHRFALADIRQAFEVAGDKRSGCVKVAVQAA
jgi:threonine dehydrogenase-like Zn-dependent dehydrogenase